MAYLPMKGLKISINDALGIGSYGKVVRARLGKLHCAAKLLHDTMFMYNDPGLQNFVKKFKEECELLSSIDHPNIVKYLGTTRDPRSGRPVLLMELMHESLTAYLERCSSAFLSCYSQVCIGHDVAQALTYLHSKSVVHRDLSSNNILLTVDGTAKVTDFGMSRLVEMHPRATPLTQCPGTLVYMPPEALMTPPQYSDKLDCFSFGVLTIQLATRQFPDPGSSTKCVEDAKYPTGRIYVPIPEVERRKKHIDKIDPNHPLLPLAIRCLDDRDTKRPSALEICDNLAPVKEEERAKHVRQAREELAKEQVEERERQQIREVGGRLSNIKKIIEEAKKEEKQHHREEKERERVAKREARAAAKAEATQRKTEKELDSNNTPSLSLQAWRLLKSKKKPRRFVGDEFDLDLTYVRPNIIAMAYPCEKVESLFRNRLQDVARFFNTKFPDHYKLYNLCSERSYDPQKFHQQVARYPFHEDEPPPFEFIVPFCSDVDDWLNKDDRNVVAIHCNDGVGRTGVMICSYLLHDKLFDCTQDALVYYAEARTQDAKAVTIPSQKRFVQYYNYLLRNQLSYMPTTVFLKAIIFEGIPHYTRRRMTSLLPNSSSGGDSSCLPRFTVHLYKTLIHISEVYTMLNSSDDYAQLKLPQPLPVSGDVKITFFHQRRKMFHFWLNTFFVDMHVMQQEAEFLEECKKKRFNDNSDDCQWFPCENYQLLKAHYGCKGITLPKAELDGAADDYKHFPENFKVHVIIDPTVPESSGEATAFVYDCVLSDYNEDDEEDMSDTDPEDEWESVSV